VSISSTSLPPPDAGSSGAITDVSYRNYDGELQTRALRWWPIARNTIRTSVNRKRMGYWIPAAIIVVIYLFLGISHYITQGVRQQAASMGADLPAQTGNAYATTLYAGVAETSLLIFVAALTVGAASIAADNRANALLVYLSKPVTRIDYLLGKWVGIFLLLSALSVTPALLMFLFFVVAYADQGFLKDNPTLIFRIIAVSVVPSALNTSLILGFSAWSKSPRLAGALFAAFTLLAATISGIFGHILQTRSADGEPSQAAAVVSNLSVGGVENGIAMDLYDVTPQQAFAQFAANRRRRRHFQNGPDGPQTFDASPAPPAPALPERPGLPAMLLVGGVLVLLPLAAAQFRIRAVEVIRG
jgi:ABC-2 type transport system permease protein